MFGFTISVTLPCLLSGFIKHNQMLEGKGIWSSPNGETEAKWVGIIYSRPRSHGRARTGAPVSWLPDSPALSTICACSLHLVLIVPWRRGRKSILHICILKDEVIVKFTKLESGKISIQVCLRTKMVLCQPHHTGGLSRGDPPLFGSAQWSLVEHLDTVLGPGDAKVN